MRDLEQDRARFSVDELRRRLELADRHYDPDRIDAMVVALKVLRRPITDDEPLDGPDVAEPYPPLEAEEIEDLVAVLESSANAPSRLMERLLSMRKDWPPMGCVLRASGVDFDPEAFLRTSTLQPSKVYKKGEPRFRTSDGLRERSGVNIPVSDAPFDDLPQQIAEAEEFLRANHEELLRLVRAPGVEGVTLDFGVELRIDGVRVAAQFDRFPPSLTRLVGELGLGLELSIYPVEDEHG